MDREYDYLFKLLLIGDSGVGKSCILGQYVDQIYIDNYISTIGVDFKIKTIEFDKKIFKLQIWDTGGQERFRSISRTYYRGAHGVLIVYDITDNESFKNIQKWIEELKNYGSNGICKVIIGNKIDDPIQNRQVEYTTAKKYSDDLDIIFIETSAKNNINIDKVFSILVQKITEKVVTGFTIVPSNKFLVIDESESVPKSNCC